MTDYQLTYRADVPGDDRLPLIRADACIADDTDLVFYRFGKEHLRVPKDAVESMSPGWIETTPTSVPGLGYFRDPQNTVVLRGRCRTTAGEEFWTLPPDSRPARDRSFRVMSNRGEVEVSVSVTGAIVVHADTEWADLGGVHFRTDWV